MEDQEASATKASGGDIMPDGLEPVSPDSEQVSPSGKPEAENPVDALGNAISRKNEEAPKSIDSNSTEVATIPGFNDLEAMAESRADELPANNENIEESESVSTEKKSATVNNIDNPSEEDSSESALVDIVDKSLDNIDSDMARKDSVESEKGSKRSGKSSDDIDNKKPTENSETEEELSDIVESVKDAVSTREGEVFEADKAMKAVSDSNKNDDTLKDTVEKVKSIESNLLNSVSDSVSKDDNNKSGDKSSDSNAVEGGVGSDKKDVTIATAEGDSGDGKEKKQNGPEECQDERKPSKGTKKHKATADGGKSSAEPEKDNRENPEFESAPETAEMSHTDSQVLDPFDELLKDDSGSKAPLRNKRRTRSILNAPDPESNMDDDTNADDDINDSSHIDDDHTEVPDDSLVDESNVADLTEGQGADEEVCLLPDTEREISEADKQRALAAKNTPKEADSGASAFDSLVTDVGDKEDDGIARLGQMKGEMTNDENGENQEGTSAENELNSLHEDIDLGEDDGLPAIDGEKDKEAEELETENLADNVIQEIPKIQETCIQCIESKLCLFRLVIEGETKYVCSNECTKLFQEVHESYRVVERKVFIKEVGPTEVACVQCNVVKDCFYKMSDKGEKYVCGEICLKAMIGEDRDKHTISRKKKCVQEIIEKEALCLTCGETKKCTFEVPIEGELRYLCSPMCVTALQKSTPSIYRVKKRKVLKVKQPMLKLKVISNATDKYLDSGHKMVAKTPEQVALARADRDKSFFRMCAQCSAPYLGNDKNLSWETMDFCNEGCLGKYQNQHGSHCANCKNEVSITSLGKYCVRFGYDIRQFCCSGCLEEFKKGLKICCYCQRDISLGYEGFLAPVGDKGQFKDFCSQFCVEKFDQMSKNPEPPAVWARCAVCSKEKPTQLEVAIDNKSSVRLCSEPCFAAFKFVNHVFPDQCRWCNKYFERKSSESYTIYTDAANHCFCTKACMNVYISNSRHIVPCNWCKVKKYNFDMIKRTLDNGQSMMMCSLNCLTLYQVSVTAVSSRRIKCDQCKRVSQAQYHLTMSDATVRNFCTYQCVMSFQGQYSKTPLVMEGDATNKQAVPTGAPRRTLNSQRSSAKVQVKALDQRSSGMPVISSVQSLATAPTPAPMVSSITRSKGKREQRKLQPVPVERTPTPPPPPPPRPLTPPPPPPPKIYNHVIIKPAPPKEVKNMSTLAKPIMVTKGITCKPNMVNKECQTEDHLQKRILIPIPVPIYVPAPMAMYSVPFPIPVPIPFPIPIPVFIPTTRNTASGIMKEIKKIHEKMPTDPFEAELLMMAEMVAGEKKKAESDSESEEDAPDARSALASPADGGFSPDPMDTGNSAFGEDVLQMALKMATEYEEPAVDLESAMTASTITPSSHPNMPTMLHPSAIDDNSPLHHHQLMILEQQRAAVAAAGRKRGSRGGALPPPSPTPAPPLTRAKRARRHEPTPTPQPVHTEPPREPQEKPDANMCLKYTFGVNAWKQWVVTKNQEMEKSSVRRKPFKSEILQLTADELNYSLCLFVKEVRKPNGSEYAPDTIYYLVLGIQQYLFENGRIDNIFTDSYYEKFTECLDEVARKFSVLYNDSQYIVTRVEEEHLWESKQLGAHSPHVLLSTLMFFNTKHFNLVTAEEHMQLSFSHIMKHWKRNPNQPGAAKIPGSRNVLLRFYPPQSALEANSRKKKVYEQQENEENPLRCPVKLYEFYLSKCPESVKTRNDVFYLMPERSCVPDSPVWYSTQALGKEPLSKMLHRVKMVKEINIALLTS